MKMADTKPSLNSSRFGFLQHFLIGSCLDNKAVREVYFSLTIYYSRYNSEAYLKHLRSLADEKRKEGDVPKSYAIWFTCSRASIILITELFNSVSGAVSAAFFFVTLFLFNYRVGLD